MRPTIDRIFDAIVALESELPYPPTVAEIGKRSGFAPSTVWGYIEKLAEEGRLTWTPGTARTIITTKETS